jgi:bis(5'-nucleosyl)-tetraphosphatase (symmetrical)
MYGNQPDTWDEHLQGNERLRLITNYFTRMRYSNAQGQLNLSDKQAPDYYPDSFAFSPWYEHIHSDWQDEKILFGHWASLQGLCPKDNIFALDTGCVWGGKLSLLRLGDDKLFQCSCEVPSL